MTTNSNDSMVLLGRVLIAALFLPAGIGKIAGFAGVSGLIASKGLPLAPVLAAATIALEIGASLALLAGLGTRVAAIALAVFTAVAAVVFHDFWAAPAAQAMAQQQAFFKNIGIVGGLLILAATGPGRFGVDARRRGERPAVA
ncbi:DoxX family protein [Caldimonas tepidiphila]|uniref:DoxX family protein n=1 Tax=Caldimonas tepidiphila TaxID=2315841 RepID=UPI000E5B350F|nr:DoxX family protein [Caldimonas tepidiphila]